MCLALPGKVLSIDGAIAQVDFEGNQTTADISVLPDIKIGDYILVHAGLGIQKFTEAEAQENLTLIRELAKAME